MSDKKKTTTELNSNINKNNLKEFKEEMARKHQESMEEMVRKHQEREEKWKEKKRKQEEKNKKKEDEKTKKVIEELKVGNKRAEKVSSEISNDIKEIETKNEKQGKYLSELEQNAKKNLDKESRKLEIKDEKISEILEQLPKFNTVNDSPKEVSGKADNKIIEETMTGKKEQVEYRLPEEYIKEAENEFWKKEPEEKYIPDENTGKLLKEVGNQVKTGHNMFSEYGNKLDEKTDELDVKIESIEKKIDEGINSSLEKAEIGNQNQISKEDTDKLINDVNGEIKVKNNMLSKAETKGLVSNEGARVNKEKKEEIEISKEQVVEENTSEEEIKKLTTELLEEQRKIKKLKRAIRKETKEKKGIDTIQDIPTVENEEQPNSEKKTEKNKEKLGKLKLERKDTLKKITKNGGEKEKIFKEVKEKLLEERKEKRRKKMEKNESNIQPANSNETSELLEKNATKIEAEQGKTPKKLVSNVVLAVKETAKKEENNYEVTSQKIKNLDEKEKKILYEIELIEKEEEEETVQMYFIKEQKENKKGSIELRKEEIKGMIPNLTGLQQQRYENTMNKHVERLEMALKNLESEEEKSDNKLKQIVLMKEEREKELNEITLEKDKELEKLTLEQKSDLKKELEEATQKMEKKFEEAVGNNELFFKKNETLIIPEEEIKNPFFGMTAIAAFSGKAATTNVTSISNISSSSINSSKQNSRENNGKREIQ
ncbi:MAG: hypothetical protein LBI70_04035 [Rickettsiales bacterium]|jgi:hypothetical protein|nr:hypothetical protein [Rickettsiales bacterium]